MWHGELIQKEDWEVSKGVLSIPIGGGPAPRQYSERLVLWDLADSCRCRQVALPCSQLCDFAEHQELLIIPPLWSFSEEQMR